MKLTTVILVLLLLIPGMTDAKAKKVDDYHWTGIDRIIAIGDLHGDYEQYINVMKSAGLVDKKGKWSGGQTHMVQTGDITDRGPDSKKIIDHLVKLAKQAKKKGGYIHMLIGNHETMNVVGDLRYVSAGEYKAFTTRASKVNQDRQWQQQLQWMKANLPEFDEMDIDAYFEEWQQRVPVGWVEHRNAWALSGGYGRWVADNKVAVQLNDTIFLHGGISQKYCKFSLESLTEQVQKALKIVDLNIAMDSILYDEFGPVWYRGLAEEKETELYSLTLDNILKRYGAKRIVVGHSPTSGVVWPRFDQRVVLNDTGIAKHYGSHKGVLELARGEATAIYGDQRIPLPSSNDEREAYLRAVIEVDSNNARMKRRLANILAEPATEAEEDSVGHVSGPVEQGATPSMEANVSPGNCQ